MLVRWRVAAAWIALLLPFGPADANSMRCGSRLLSEGMLAAEAVAICGEPDFVDVWPLPHGYGPGHGLHPRIEEWVYNRGSSQLLRVLQIRNGRVHRIDTEGYGFPAQGAGSCGQSDITRGMSKYRLLSRCGEPIARAADYVLVPDRRYRHGSLHDPYHALIRVFREEWTYNFGSSHLLRIVILENGRVADVRSGRRGFDP
ncbi:DUF2845 domain-containing protein [Sinimarinibacterium thermocellulolyticum]